MHGDNWAEMGAGGFWKRETGRKLELGFCSDLEMLANLKKTSKLQLCVLNLYYMTNNKINTANAKYG